MNVVADLADEDSISAAVQAVSQKIGPDGLNLLINNAAVNKPVPPASLLDTRKSDMMEAFEINVVGQFVLSKVCPVASPVTRSNSPPSGDQLTALPVLNRVSKRRAAVPNTDVQEANTIRAQIRETIPPSHPLPDDCVFAHSRKRESPHGTPSRTHPETPERPGDEMSCRRSAIINISSTLASLEKCPENFHMAHMFPYRISKAALNMLTRCQAEDFKRHKVLVTAIHPGWVRTDMGGQQAPLTPEDSVVSMLGVMSSLSKRHTGTFLSWEGNTIPW
ncbi:uncharacterized protein zgc:158868 [Nematolebias whitei]|uniref:uncharacterized protein zgc:158868 n=1 Tax=Nematolebias whitei TaxID=451745 RepID=UPI001897F3AD|nr:uncharacterized protein zgc:158868 [Nematolebias whitei]